jgi:hypothetical protein
MRKLRTWLIGLLVPAPRYNVDEAHADPGIEEFAVWLAYLDHEIPSYGDDELGYWRDIADRAAAAGFLRYAGPDAEGGGR